MPPRKSALVLEEGTEMLAAGNCLLRKKGQNSSRRIYCKEAFELD